MGSIPSFTMKEVSSPSFFRLMAGMALVTMVSFIFQVQSQAAPVVTVVSPEFGKSFAFGTTVNVSITATGSIKWVVLVNNHGKPDTIKQAPYTFSYSDLIPGYYAVEARVTATDQTTTIVEQPYVIRPKPYPALPPSPAANGKVKVFILAGQSNMEGKGKLHSTTTTEQRGTMDFYLKTQPEQYGHLVNAQGKPIVRDDVWVVIQSYTQDQGWLTAGWGGVPFPTLMGPEYAFGWVMGNYFNDPVVLIKTAWGGKSLAVDFLSPSSGSYPTPKVDGDAGYYYQQMIAVTKKVVANLKTYFPSYNGNGYEIMGLAWHQGWNDLINGDYVAAYEKNMVNLIKDARKDLGIPDLPFALANSGFAGWDHFTQSAEGSARNTALCMGQLAVADYTKYPEFKNNTGAADTRGFLRRQPISPSDQGYHWWRNFETYYLIGESIAHAMLSLFPFNRPTSVLGPAVQSSPVEFDFGIKENAVQFILPERSAYSLSVFNVAGKAVKTFRGEGVRGLNHVTWSLQELPNGVLFMRLSAGWHSAEKKISRLK